MTTSKPRTPPRRGPRPTSLLVAAVTAATLCAAPAQVAGAAPAPAAAPALPATVSADALPTVQVDGVVWSQAVVGGRVYVTGSFASARPAGAAPGTGETPRGNLLAYDLATGDLVAGWAPSLNAQGLAITASPDGTRLYVGGDFTAVDGRPRSRLVALDAATGAVLGDDASAPAANARVRALAAVGDTLYAGGSFSTVSGQARSRLVALRTTDGAVTAWDPGADAEVLALTAPAGTGSLVVGGRFARLGGVRAYGLGALGLSSGASRPFAANRVVRNAGRDAAVWSLTSAAGRVYGTGYVYGPGGNLENAFAADAATGALTWVSGCRGDSYGVAPAGPVLYAVGHPHDCSMIGGNPESRPRTWQRAQAMTADRSPTGRTNTSGAFSGRPAPELLHWLPTLRAGAYTGQTQAAWSVAAADGYVVLGGEFPAVNGVAQQGLVRFRTRDAAPNLSGPIGYEPLQPQVEATGPGTVRLTWQAAWDRDDPELTYEVLRDDEPVAAATRQESSTWWSRPPLEGVDDTAPGGTLSYRVRVSDPAGNTMTSLPTTVTVVAANPPPTTPVPPGAPSAYADAVADDAPLHHWRLDEASGAVAADSAAPAARADLALDPSAVRGVAGATGDGDAALSLPGTALVPGTTTTAEPGPAAFSLEVWLRTPTTRGGGKLLGFGDSARGLSGNYDRQLWMGDDGRVHVGVNDGALRTLTTPDRLDDGAWHHVAATMGPGGLALYVDGASVATDAGATRAQPFDGYWRLGGDTVAFWPGASSATSFTGDLDDAAVYPTPLSAQRVAAHVAASGRTVPGGTPPAQPPAPPPPAPPAPPQPPALPQPPAPQPQPPVPQLPIPPSPYPSLPPSPSSSPSSSPSPGSS